MDLAIEALRQESPLTLTELSQRVGVPGSNLSAAISKAIPEGRPIHRVERGVYAYGVEELELENAGQVVAAEETKRTYHPPGEAAREASRIRKVRNLANDLILALDELNRWTTKLEAKARAYDKVQLTINGRVEDPL